MSELNTDWAMFAFSFGLCCGFFLTVTAIFFIIRYLPSRSDLGHE